jgi:hypothetical protein
MSNKSFTLSFLFFCGFYTITSAQKNPQTPAIEWQKCFGGSQNDGIVSVINTADGGYLYVGNSASANGDLSTLPSSLYNCPYWVVKIDKNGAIEWQKCFDRQGDGKVCSVVQATDLGYLLLVTTFGVGVDFNCNQTRYNSSDLWLAKLSPKGDLQWQKCLGGSKYDKAGALIKTIDGGYLVSGSTESTDGESEGNHGGFDGLIVKLSATGTIEWRKCIGGLGYEELNAIKQTGDGGFILGGQTTSTNGDATGSTSRGYFDVWIVKITPLGVIQWQKRYGGGDLDNVYSIIQTVDGGYAFVGETNANGGDVIGHHYNVNTPIGDAWVVKLTPTGTIQWQKCLGGTLQEVGKAIIQVPDGGYIIAAQSGSQDGDLPWSFNQPSDALAVNGWLVKLTPQGSIEWKKIFGGTD